LTFLIIWYRHVKSEAISGNRGNPSAKWGDFLSTMQYRIGTFGFPQQIHQKVKRAKVLRNNSEWEREKVGSSFLTVEKCLHHDILDLVQEGSLLRHP
jgi:hypothetical protein